MPMPKSIYEPPFPVLWWRQGAASSPAASLKHQQTSSFLTMQFKYLAAFMVLSSGVFASAPSGDDLVFGSVGISQVQSIKQPHGNILEARGDDDEKKVPAECTFAALKHGSFWYWSVKRGSRKACLAARVSSQPLDVCRHDAFWPEEDINDIVKVMEEQVTKDGLFKKS